MGIKRSSFQLHLDKMREKGLIRKMKNISDEMKDALEVEVNDNNIYQLTELGEVLLNFIAHLSDSGWIDDYQMFIRLEKSLVILSTQPDLVSSLTLGKVTKEEAIKHFLDEKKQLNKAVSLPWSSRTKQ